MRESQGDMNRPFFMNLLAQEWFACIPEIRDKLAAGGRVADIGSGFGWSSIGIAIGYNKITVEGDYDLVAAFECIHDMPDPVSTLATMRRISADDGIVVVMDEKVADAFSPDAGEVEQLMYGFSNFICLPDGMSTPHSAGTGTVMRPDTLRRYARGAGFRDIEILPIETGTWRFYRLV